MERGVRGQEVSSDVSSIGSSFAHKCSLELDKKDRVSGSKDGYKVISNKLDSIGEPLSIYGSTNISDTRSRTLREIKESHNEWVRKELEKNNGFTFAEGGTWHSVTKVNYSGSKNERTGGGLRKETTVFTYGSQGRFRSSLTKINQDVYDHSQVRFITLTYDGNTEKNKWIVGKEYKRHLKNITQAITRKYGGFGLWKWELQKRLVGHWHLIWCGVSWIDHKWVAKRWNEITNGSEDHLLAGVQVEEAKSWRGVEIYGCKLMGYVMKDDSSRRQRDHMKRIHVGRHWGIVNRDAYDAAVTLVDGELKKSAVDLVFKIEGKMQKKWKKNKIVTRVDGSTRKGDYKGWRRQKKKRQYWSSLDNVTIQFSMSNDNFIKLVNWCNEAAGDTVTFGAVSSFDELKEIRDRNVKRKKERKKSGFKDWNSKINLIAC